MGPPHNPGDRNTLKKGVTSKIGWLRHHSYSSQPEAIAGSQEGPPGDCGGLPLTTDPPGNDRTDNDGGGDGRTATEDPPRAQEQSRLRAVLRYLDVARRVQELESENKQLTERCNKAETDIEGKKLLLRETRKKIEFLVLKLYPGAIKVDDSSPPKFSELVDRLLSTHETQWFDVKNLRQQLQDREDSHQREKSRMERVHSEKFHNQERVHAGEKASLKIDYDRRIHEQLVLHNKLVDGLETDHKNQLHEQKVNLEKDKAVLKEGLLATVDRFQPITDSVLGSRFKQLKNSVCTLARSPLNDAEGLIEAFDQRAFAQTIPRRHYKFILESTFWRILIEYIFSTPFRVFGHYGTYFTTTWSALFQKYPSLDQSTSNWPQPDTLSEKWRYVTFEQLRAGLSENVESHTTDEDIRASYMENISSVSSALSAALSRASSLDKRAEIHAIVEEACSLARDFGTQRCRLQTFAPRPNDTVSTTEGGCEDANDQNDSSLTVGVVQFEVSPGLRKMGDGRGGFLDQTSNLCPAVVYLTATRM